MIENTNAINWWNTVFTHWHLINVHIFYSLQMYWTASLFWQALQILQSVNGRTRIRFDFIFFLCYKIQNSCCTINERILYFVLFKQYYRNFYPSRTIWYFVFYSEIIISLVMPYILKVTETFLFFDPVFYKLDFQTKMKTHFYMTLARFSSCQQQQQNTSWFIHYLFRAETTLRHILTATTDDLWFVAIFSIIIILSQKKNLC